MQTIPNSTLYLCKNVDLDPNYNYTIDFDNITAQASYFDSKIATEFEINEGYSYVRDTQAIKVQAKVDDLLGINYLFYNNGNKRYYAFITKKEYVSETCTKINFKLDVLQSFMFNYTLNECFVEREHQDSWLLPTDSINLKPIFNREIENIDVGNDYDVSISSFDVANQDAIMWVELITSKAISSQSGSNDENLSITLTQNRVYSNVFVYLYPVMKNNENVPIYVNIGGVSHKIDNSIIDWVKASTAVLSERVIPYCPVKCTISRIISSTEEHFSITILDGCKWVTAGQTEFGGIDLSNFGGNHINLKRINESNINAVIGSLNPYYDDITLTVPSYNDLKSMDYEPKLKIYPYSYIQLSDNQSQPLTVKYEDIDTIKEVKYIQAVATQYKAKLYVENYNGDHGKHYNSVNSTINELALTNNAYIQYMAQNKASATTGVAVNMATTALTAGIGLATGGLGLVAGLGIAINQGQQIANQMIKMQDLKNTPDSIRQTGNNAEFDIVDKNIGVNIYYISIKEEYLTRLYNYLYHYGYKCNNFKVPNTRSRYYFNYIKTIGATLSTNIDSEWAEEIKQVYDNGVTIWHYRDANTFKGINNYDYENVQVNLLGG